MIVVFQKNVNARIISGNVLTGKEIKPDGFWISTATLLLLFQKGMIMNFLVGINQYLIKYQFQEHLLFLVNAK